MIYLMDCFGFFPNNRFTAATALSIFGPMNQATRGVNVNVKNQLVYIKWTNQDRKCCVC